MSFQDSMSSAEKSYGSARGTSRTGSDREHLGRREVRVPAPGGAQLLAVLRIMIGLTFLWAFLDKMFGWGYATGAAKAWVNGGSPTSGFLSHVEVGPLQSVLRALAGSGVADWLLMFGLAVSGSPCSSVSACVSLL